MSDSSPSLASYGEGIALICIFISSSLYGLTSFQGITYFRTFPRDPWLLRLTVASVTFLVTFHIAICWHFTYRYFINDFGNYGLLFVPLWTLSVCANPDTVNIDAVLMIPPKATIPVTYIAKCIYHMFFLTRIWTLSGKNRVLCGVILLLEAAHVGVTMEFTSKWTDTLISSLILYTINSGMITAIGDLVVLGLFLGLPNNAAFIGAFEITIELCTNAILTSLNTRTRLRSRLAEFTDAELYNIARLDPATRRSLRESTCMKPPNSPISNSPFSMHLDDARRISVPDKAMLKSDVSAPVI
ncbi:hypothetical protein SISNIDRAFT_491317 [Sistotremastrum niveocremeum HHB9708]|uniref:DUF6534 domain-containing protein n=1 Tax=Sistotremastrum niveocremeum HHB9708 TaxID=1314777 RepID=A0A164MYG5_9AGAM|nr:hypothetical protein SISNIDRAFT_491317 [Sistotremastrum niveocremeum HHB9708]